MIVFHDPPSLPSRQFVDTLTTVQPPGTSSSFVAGDYAVVDWSDPAQQAQYPNAAIRAFPSLLVVMSDGSTGFVDCTDPSVNVLTYQDALGMDNTVNQVPNTDGNGNPLPGTHPVAADSRIQLVGGD